MTSLFLSEVESALQEISQKHRGRVALKKKKHALIVCGVSAKSINERVAALAEAAIDGLRCEVLAVENEFFGKTVTCTGLLTGVDMLAALKTRLANHPCGEVILAGNTMKEFEDVFLCGTTLSAFEKELSPFGVKVRVNREGGRGLVQILTK